jgi:hypothetical protein
MAYVVARPRGRFEIRESVHTPLGPRARSLANFARFSDQVLERARKRATRPFDAEAVRAAVRRLTETDDAPSVRGASDVAATVPRHEQPETRRFVEAARRMAMSLERLPDKADRKDPGQALISLFDFVAHVSASPPPGPPKPLRFPPLGLLRAARRANSTG